MTIAPGSLNHVRLACIHFNGLEIGDKTCDAGIRYSDVQDDSPGGRRWPCMPSLPGRAPCTIECPKKRVRTPEEVAAFEAEVNAAVEQSLARAARGECHHCGAPVEAKIREGRCLYAKPCGHRIGQAAEEEDEFT